MTEVRVNMGNGDVAILRPDLYAVDRALIEDGPTADTLAIADAFTPPDPFSRKV